MIESIQEWGVVGVLVLILLSFIKALWAAYKQSERNVHELSKSYERVVTHNSYTVEKLAQVVDKLVR